MIELLKEVKAESGKVRKFIYKSLVYGDILEVAVVDNGTNKNIFCLPSQSYCNQKCSFCYSTSKNLQVRNLTAEELTLVFVATFANVYDDINLDNPILISFMGMGEPLLNIDNLIKFMKNTSKISSRTIRYALSTTFPWIDSKFSCLYDLIAEVIEHKIPLKLHWSLHFTRDEIRKIHMPHALGIVESSYMLRVYGHYTGNPVEVHYSLIKGLNDSKTDLANLITKFKNWNIPIKFLRFNPKPNSPLVPSDDETLSMFMDVLKYNDIPCEYYEPNGRDVGASCGQFILEEYGK